MWENKFVQINLATVFCSSIEWLYSVIKGSHVALRLKKIKYNWRVLNEKQRGIYEPLQIFFNDTSLT